MKYFVSVNIIEYKNQTEFEHIESAEFQVVDEKTARIVWNEICQKLERDKRVVN